MFLIELVLTIGVILAVFSFPELGSAQFRPLEQRFARLAQSRWLAVTMVTAAALFLRLLLLPIEVIPEPTAQDEFSYLLAADTFVHGRITNPTHPMWIHFETFHVIHQPTYTSMYYPAQGIFLAAGQVLMGKAFWGVWLSVGLMCGAICWMLQGWLPPPWALLGGTIAIIRLGAFSYWGNSYWGGAVAATGGALVLGALPRIIQHHRRRDAVVMAVGLALLANSRPYESLFLGLPVAIALFLWMFGENAPPFRALLAGVVLPIGAVLTITAAGMLYYFWRTTGSPVQTPYLVELRIYDPVPFFPWQHVKPMPEYRHPEIRNFYTGWWLQQYQLERQHPVLVRSIAAGIWWFFYLGPVLTLPLVFLVWHLRNRPPSLNISRKTRLLVAVCLAAFIGSMIPVYFMPHYAAPVTAAVYAGVLLSMRQLRHWQWRQKPVGLELVRAVPILCVVLLLLRASSSAIGIPSPTQFPASWCSGTVQLLERARISDHLETLPGRHLAIVQYRPDHDPTHEWVYNKADIDGAKVVWARDMGTRENEELIRYFKDRQVWVVEADEMPSRLFPYSAVK